MLAATGLAFAGAALHRLAQTNLYWAAPAMIVIIGAAIGRLDLAIGQPRWARVARIVAGATVSLFPILRCILADHEK